MDLSAAAGVRVVCVCMPGACALLWHPPSQWGRPHVTPSGLGFPGHHLGCSGPAPWDGAGGEGCCVPSRDMRDFFPLAWHPRCGDGHGAQLRLLAGPRPPLCRGQEGAAAAPSCPNSL